MEVSGLPPAGTLLASRFESVPDMWRNRVASTPDTDAFITRHGTYWRETTWQAANRRVVKLANALLAHGLEAEDRCIIFAHTSLEWILADLGILCAGGATTTVFPATTDKDCMYILKDCAARVIFCGTAEQAQRIVALGKLDSLELIVCFENKPAPDGEWLTLDAFEAAGLEFSDSNPDAYQHAFEKIEPTSLATLMYTSGTTGVPKGVMLTHASWVYVAESIDAMEILSPVDTHYLFLPLSHVFAKVLQVILIRLGLTTVVDSNTDRLREYLAETQPSIMAAVPSVFENAYKSFILESRAGGASKERLFEWAIQVGHRASLHQQNGTRMPRRLRLQWQLADRMVLRKIRQAFGGRIRFFISGGAPLSKEIAEFFHACGLLILEGYGLTESTAASTFNQPDNFRFGTVGKPIPGCEVKIASDGEVLLRSRAIMTGYYRRPKDTRSALTEDGWLRTGDIGIIHPSGHLQITDRKKEIIVTSRGKNIAPTNFENRLKAASSFCSFVVMHGDRRPYCTAVIGLGHQALASWATDRELSFVNYQDLVQLPEVNQLIRKSIELVNRELPSYEQVRNFVLMSEEPTVENGLLTPTQKIKRGVVEKRYTAQLDSLYHS